MTKRTLAAALACLLALTTAGCGAGGGGEGADAPTEPPAHTEDSSSMVAEATAAPVPTPAPTPAATPAPAPTKATKGLVRDGWVCGIPDYVPRFSYGDMDIKRSSYGEGGISTVFHLRFTGVGRENINEYHKALKSAGYLTAAADIGDSYTLTASKDLGWNSVSLVITLIEADGEVTYALDAPV